MNRNEIDFTERMQIGRDLAQVARNKGQSTGKRAVAPLRATSRLRSWSIQRPGQSTHATNQSRQDRVGRSQTRGARGALNFPRLNQIDA